MRAVWLAALIGMAAHATPSGWRHDGTGRWPDVDPPVRWSESDAAFVTPLPTWSNASPVVADGRVCALSEPVVAWCADADTGRLMWSAEHPVLSALQGPARERAEQAMAEYARLGEALKEARATFGRLGREARGGRLDLAPQVDAAAREVGALQAALDALPRLETPPSQGLVGWSSPTPVTDGRSLYALFGNGVVAARTLDGALRWSRWLGEPPERMLGWDEGQSASPLLVDQVLAVPYGELRGLDPDTGEQLWSAGPWPHFGSPAALQVGDDALLATPDGRLLRARDGVELASGLAEMWYLAPLVDGDRVLFLEARSDQVLLEAGGVDLRAVRVLGVEGDRARVEPLWTTRIPTRHSFYAAPVVVDGRVHAVDHAGDLWTLDIATGRLLGNAPVLAGPAKLFASPALAAGRLYLIADDGRVAVLQPGAAPQVLAVNPGWPTRASPVFAGGRLYVRAREALVAVGR